MINEHINTAQLHDTWVTKHCQIIKTIQRFCIFSRYAWLWQGLSRRVMIPRYSYHGKALGNNTEFLGDHFILLCNIAFNQLVFLVRKNSDSINNISAYHDVLQMAKNLLIQFFMQPLTIKPI